MQNGFKKHIGCTFILLLAATVLSGCGGQVRETRSSFDGSTELSIGPAHLYNDKSGVSVSGLQMGLFRRSTMAAGMVRIDVLIKGAHSFPAGNSLHFNIDGKTVSFPVLRGSQKVKTEGGKYYSGTGTYIAPYNMSSASYIVDMALLERILTAGDVHVKMETRDLYVEGVFSRGGLNAVRPAFQKFYDRLSGKKLAKKSPTAGTADDTL